MVQRVGVDPRAVGLPLLTGAAPSALDDVEASVGAAAAPVLLLQVPTPLRVLLCLGCSRVWGCVL